MTTTPPDVPGVEPDGRFPSGPWTGFFIQPPFRQRHWMELVLTFRDAIIKGEGRDHVGEFLIKGRYEVETGKCGWTKSYVGKHAITYQGYNEGQGIWGTWEWSREWKGGFHIWPVAMRDPTQSRLVEEVDEPVPYSERPEFETIGAPAELVEMSGPKSGQSFSTSLAIAPASSSWARCHSSNSLIPTSGDIIATLNVDPAEEKNP